MSRWASSAQIGWDGVGWPGAGLERRGDGLVRPPCGRWWTTIQKVGIWMAQAGLTRSWRVTKNVLVK